MENLAMSTWLDPWEIDQVAECLPINDMVLHAKLWGLLETQVFKFGEGERGEVPGEITNKHLQIGEVWEQLTIVEQATINRAIAEEVDPLTA